jgi:hypothetical protein
MIAGRNSIKHMALKRTWIFEPSDCEDWVTTVHHCLLQQLAFSKSHHFSWEILPANTMAYDTLPHD